MDNWLHDRARQAVPYGVVEQRREQQLGIPPGTYRELVPAENTVVFLRDGRLNYPL